ncbi:hypothetical protein BDR07DRAFT_1383220 [Suillus spraguei]|nr:hypothetical protein BDR07DRAFT_1383220 [Suillus spraguei]
MSLASDDSSWQPSISSYEFLSYWLVAAGAVVAYDWVLTLGQEIELIWTRYTGMPYYMYVFEANKLVLYSNSLIISIRFWHTAFTPLASLTDGRVQHHVLCFKWDKFGRIYHVGQWSYPVAIPQ